MILSLLEQSFGTLTLRPYVFAFWVVFMVSAFATLGRRKTLTMWFGTWVVAFISEYLSTRVGFPYGLYHYTEFTRGKELFISNVPFFDSLSYSFILFASYSLALFLVSPIYMRGFRIEILHTYQIRQSKRVLVLTALLMLMIDVVIDPVALQGSRWFLGKIYYYEYTGNYFGVPISNALGWGLVAFVACALFQFFERKIFGKGEWFPGMKRWPNRTLFGPGLYFGILAFNLAITWWIGERGLFIAGCFIFLLPIVLFVLRVIDIRVRVSEEEWQRYMNLLR